MAILANVYFDIAAVSQGIVFLLFCIPVVLLSEFEVYRVLCPKQGLIRSIIASVYANAVSGILGIFSAETIEDVIIITFGSAGFLYNISLFVSLFLLTYVLEVGAIYLIYRKLKVEKVFISVGVANVVSYAILAIMVFLFELIKGL